jgi:hypothetical protein
MSELLVRWGMTGYVLAAYALTWAVLLVYTTYLNGRVRRGAAALRNQDGGESP